VKEATVMSRPNSRLDRAPYEGRDRDEEEDRIEGDDVAEPRGPAIDQDLAGSVNAALPDSDD
jgi:hypothetical protein